MKLAFTGGGSGGHFYPLVAVMEQVNLLKGKNNLSGVKMYYLGESKFNEKELVKNGVEFVRVYSSRVPVGFSLGTLVAILRLIVGFVKTFFVVFSIYPDVVLSKGGHVAFNVVLSAWLLGIPIIIHETDVVPGRVNDITSRFADYVAVSFKEAVKYFKDKGIKAEVVWTGQPIRQEIMKKDFGGAKELLRIFDDYPVVMVLGGSQGARAINDVLIGLAPKLVERCHVIHQVGEKNLEEVKRAVDGVLKGHKLKDRYRVYGSLSAFALSSAASISDLVVSRAGGTIFEIALWGLPSILIPLKIAYRDHQRLNANVYKEAGACVVIEEDNLTSAVLMDQIETILEDDDLRKRMSEAARGFAREDAAEIIASKMLSIALKHVK